ncbi:hypothetical protein [Okeania sp. SIO1I7]|uniref:hypothetical protein n=1 Tax=Okeania sp. SIO1I7 TaxID=2607772 RepID=UPI0013FC6198|nr:hypothetical protein [Okeania sp. SIO1I7]NET28490.1 hypothetical protein [Okeania sp. SIO1I7]
MATQISHGIKWENQEKLHIALIELHCHTTTALFAVFIECLFLRKYQLLSHRYRLT